MLAAGNGRMEVAKYLVDQGADVHIYNQVIKSFF